MNFSQSAIATKLNILDSAIIEIQEWANVLWVKFIGGCRFVSKKNGVNKMALEQHELSVSGLNGWRVGQKFRDGNRVLEIAEITGESPRHEIDGVTYEGDADGYADREWTVQTVNAVFVKNI
jgi:hypothetical protein